MELEQTIYNMAEKALEDPSLFVVVVKISGGGSHRKIRVLLDGDQGISIDNCAEVSRAIADEVEVLDLIPTAYNLEVSSAGIDTPLTLARQYQKNIGRRVKINTNEGKTHQGELLSFTNDLMTINEEVKLKGKKKIEIAELTIALADINKTNVLVTFK